MVSPFGLSYIQKKERTRNAPLLRFTTRQNRCPPFYSATNVRSHMRYIQWTFRRRLSPRAIPVPGHPLPIPLRNCDESKTPTDQPRTRLSSSRVPVCRFCLFLPVSYSLFFLLSFYLIYIYIMLFPLINKTQSRSRLCPFPS